MKRWDIRGKLKVQSEKFKVDELIDLLLENRGIKTDKEREEFLNPKLSDVHTKSVNIDSRQLKKALTRIKKAIDKKEQIVIYGDYDVDGITASAILWETLYSLGASVAPYIPHRVDQGYGLSIQGIDNIKSQKSNIKDVSLIITVDNGIVANEAVDFANANNIDVIVTDHHAVGEKLPDAYAIVHTTQLCGVGIAWVLSKEITKACHPELVSGSSEKDKEMLKPSNTAGMQVQHDNSIDDKHLELAALGTIADLVPLTGANRAIVKYGLPALSKTKRVGLRALFLQAGLDKDNLSVSDVGYIIAPRLNAAGRIESAMDSLRLLCTKDPQRARFLAENLESTNRERQFFMRKATEHAIDEVKKQESKLKKMLIVAHESYPEGVIGLVAGKLVEEFYRPSIVIAKGEKQSKGSVRSISGFNIIEFLRTKPEHFLGLGGHPMAAGFTIETDKIIILQESVDQITEDLLNEDLLTRSVKIDCVLPLYLVNDKLYSAIQHLAPFGMGNPEPVFASQGVTIESMKKMGREGNHLKLVLSQHNSGEERSSDSRIANERDSEPSNSAGRQARMTRFEAVAFRMADLADDLHVGDKVDVAYTVDENTWNGTTKIQLKVKDLKL